MKNKRHIELLLKRGQTQLNSAEAEELQAIRRDEEAQQNERVFELSKRYSGGFEPNSDRAWKGFKQRMEEETKETPVRRLNPLRTIFRVAAAILVLVVAYFVFQPSSGEASLQAELVYAESGTQKIVRLPDGTEVTLNEETELSYTPFPNPNTGKRSVYLNGEAYFDVASDKDHPFVIESKNTKVEVLGTAFNLRAYEKESFTELDVDHGKVRFSSNEGAVTNVVTKQQKARIVEEGDLIMDLNSTSNAQAWRTKTLRFKNTSLEKVLHDIQRHYGVNIQQDQLEVPDCNHNSTYRIDRDKLEDIFRSLERHFNLKIQKQSDNQYIVSGGSC